MPMNLQTKLERHQNLVHWYPRTQRAPCSRAVVSFKSKRNVSLDDRGLPTLISHISSYILKRCGLKFYECSPVCRSKETKSSSPSSNSYLDTTPLQHMDCKLINKVIPCFSSLESYLALLVGLQNKLTKRQ
jgi:hypothetical protein